MNKLFLYLVFFLAFPATLAAQTNTHLDPVAPVAMWLVVILLGAMAGRELAALIHQPAVLGELVLGVLLGNLGFLFGFTGFEAVKIDPFIEMFARVGVLVLLFEIGLESTVGQMLKVGWSALAVAVLGVFAPFLLGWGVGAWLLPDRGFYAHIFLGAMLTATSVGITARVLKDIGRSQSKEARIILGAAVIDDVLGLVILAIVSGLIAAADSGRSFRVWDIAAPLGKAAGFLVGSLVLGVVLSQWLFSLASKLKSRGVLLGLGLIFCFFLSWLAHAIGLAPIVGAFAAGLILEDCHYTEFVRRGERGLEELIHPISSFLVPVFFVLMGMRANLRSFSQPDILGFAMVLTVAAIIGKQACSLGVIGKIDRLSIGIGMIPRGEVGLIFANIGLAITVGGQRIVSEGEFSAVVIMVILTTMMTPPALKWSLGRRSNSR